MIELFVDTQFGLSGQSANCPIESGLVPAQLAKKIKIKQIRIFENGSRMDVNIKISSCYLIIFIVTQVKKINIFERL